MAATTIQKKLVHVMLAVGFCFSANAAVRITVVKEEPVIKKVSKGKLSEVRFVSGDPINIVIDGNDPEVPPVDPVYEEPQTPARLQTRIKGGQDGFVRKAEESETEPAVAEAAKPKPYKASKTETLGAILQRWSTRSGKVMALERDNLSQRISKVRILDDMTFTDDAGGSLLSLVSVINASIRTKGFYIVVAPTPYGFKLEVKSDY